MLTSSINAMKEKLDENQFKDPIVYLSLGEAMVLMKGEMQELLEELDKEEWDYAAIRRELADIQNFAGAGIVACERRMK